MDIGDFIGVSGFVFKTKVGEISISAEKFDVLSKSIRPLPIVKEKEERSMMPLKIKSFDIGIDIWI